MGSKYVIWNPNEQSNSLLCFFQLFCSCMTLLISSHIILLELMDAPIKWDN